MKAFISVLVCFLLFIVMMGCKKQPIKSKTTPLGKILEATLVPWGRDNNSYRTMIKTEKATLIVNNTDFVLIGGQGYLIEQIEQGFPYKYFYYGGENHASEVDTLLPTGGISPISGSIKLQSENSPSPTPTAFPTPLPLKATCVFKGHRNQTITGKCIFEQ